ncbi:hypothetical protein EIP91_008936 [Steccherinum ochraceum]|uniref:Uncharacterized protein n=1 Tax=Steccherinum ochraceum TaxID=92696 RepID=A0A4R0RX78_9APHY|nr:hypothetical protein EIP91_008936 [Steccherinum ochraceum]
MSWDAVRQASVILEVIGIALLLALLITPAPKHAIVNALAVATILRSVFAIIQSVMYQRFRDEFDHILLHPNIANFCIGFSIILRYLTVVKAAFTVSFTLPLFYLAIQHSRYTGFSSSSSSAFYRGTIGILCVGPFIWALPTILVAIPPIMNNKESLKPMFYQATCTISNTPYQVVSLSLMIVALFFATEEVFEVWSSWYQACKRGLSFRRPRRTHLSEPPTQESYLDFASAPGISRWQMFRHSETSEKGRVIVNIKQESFTDQSDESRPPTPMKEDISQDSRPPEGPSSNAKAISIHIIPSTPVSQSVSTPPPPTSPQTRNQPLNTDQSSLRPPPRPARSRSESPADGPTMRHPFAQMPSLTAFGNGRDSWDDARMFVRSSRYGDVESGADDSGTSRSKSVSPEDRPGTGQTTGTFGDHS